jgi:hypothetical protein
MALIDERYVGHRPDLWAQQTSVTFTIPTLKLEPEPMTQEPTFGPLNSEPVLERPKTVGEFRTWLASGDVEIVFVDAKGAKDTITGTLWEIRIPEEHRPKTQGVSLKEVVMSPMPGGIKKPAVDENLVRFYSLDRAGWRAVRWERVLGAKKIG